MFTHRIFSSLLILLVSLFLVGGGSFADFADAKARSGGRSFSKFKSKKPPKLPVNRSITKNKNQSKTPPPIKGQRNKDNSFVKGLAGGFLGSTIGSLLFGSMLGAGGGGMGLLPLLLLGGVGWFLYRQFSRKKRR